jgi:cytoskeletal protein CcmA (bactofilin family)
VRENPAALVGHGLVVRGEVHSSEDLLIEGRIDGPIWSEGAEVTVAHNAHVNGEIFAHTIVVLGHVAGTMVASSLVDIRSSAFVTGRVLASKLILDEGASFNGKVQPQHLDAALRVARHRHTDDPSR